MKMQNRLVHIASWFSFALILFIAFGQKIRAYDTPSGLTYDLSYDYYMLLVICIDTSFKSLMFYKLYSVDIRAESYASFKKMIIIAGTFLASTVFWIGYQFIFNLDTNDMIFSYMLPYSMVFHLVIAFLSNGYASIALRKKIEQEKTDLEKFQIESELRLLKSQINPHFLFNTLNNIYSISRKSNIKELPESISKLSHLMRYMIYDSSRALVSLSQELSYLQDYVDLQMLRMVNPSIINLEISVEDEHCQISPMLFIPFVENAFKYGSGSDNIAISIHEVGHVITLNVINGICQMDHFENHGFGLKNVRKRLELLYANRYWLTIKEDENFYSVSLKLNLDLQ